MLTESLTGITVIEVGSTVVAPYATQALGALGADVIKVEPPGGEAMRRSEPQYDSGMAGYFAMCNGEKRSIEIDLKHDDGLAVFYELVDDADVLVQNLSPGTADRLGIGYDDCREITEDIVYCAITGYGDSGPWSDRPAYDPILQGASGLMSVTGPKGGPGVKIGVAITDLVTAIWSVVNIQSALMLRERTGEGTYIDMSMLDVGVSLLTKQATVALIEDRVPEPLGTHDLWVTPYGAYPTADDERIIVCTATQDQWTTLCELLDREELQDDERFVDRASRLDNRDELDAVLAEAFREHTREEWLDALQGVIPVGTVRNVPEALSNAQVDHNDVLGEITHEEYGTVDVLNLPIRWEDGRHEYRSPPPTAGEHAEEILREHGLSPSTIDELRDEDVV